MAGTILTVGPGQEYSAICDAVADAQDGDTIQVLAGTYIDDFAEISKNITLEGIGGTVNMVSDELIPNGKGIFVTNGNISISNFIFSGAQVDDNNGAGIRYESGNLILNNDYFHDNEMGLLGGFDPSGSITVINCEFANNSVRDPNSDHIGHNLYAGDVVGSLTIDHSYFHDAQIGHEIKSRALNTVITNSWIQDGPTGTASYSVDLPNGGNALIQNNVIDKGPLSENSTIITIGEEGSIYDATSIQISSNEIFNHSLASSVLAVRNLSDATAVITGNEFHGITETQVAEGPNTQSDNLFFVSDNEPLTPSAVQLTDPMGTAVTPSMIFDMPIGTSAAGSPAGPVEAPPEHQIVFPNIGMSTQGAGSLAAQTGGLGFAAPTLSDSIQASGAPLFLSDCSIAMSRNSSACVCAAVSFAYGNDGSIVPVAGLDHGVS